MGFCDILGKANNSLCIAMLRYRGECIGEGTNGMKNRDSVSKAMRRNDIHSKTCTSISLIQRLGYIPPRYASTISMM